MRKNRHGRGLRKRPGGKRKERVEGPSQDKGKGRALASEEVRGEVTGVVCDLCDKKGIPCRWGKVSILTLVFSLLTDL